MSKYLIDTNVVLALLLGRQDRIDASVAEELESINNEILLSAVSVWEICLKRSIGKLSLDESWSSVLRRMPFTPLPVTFRHALKMEVLPWIHRDPFDRMLVAQAIHENAVLVTRDRVLTKYDANILLA